MSINRKFIMQQFRDKRDGRIIFEVKQSLEGALKESKGKKISLAYGILSRFNCPNTKLSEVIFHNADLHCANLSGADLSFANLQQTDLSGANLSGANLSGAKLFCANLHNANLSGADLSGADLSDADLSEADLHCAKLRHANLTYANLSRANLTDANLSRANLTAADLIKADLIKADLTDADLTDADLKISDLRRANLHNANLRGADLRDAEVFQTVFDDNYTDTFNFKRTRIIPEEGAFFAWKKCQNDVLVKLFIPAEAPRCHAMGRKCRAAFVDVVDVIGAEVGVSLYDTNTTYKVGQRVFADFFNPDWRFECTSGIHFFPTRKEAEVYY